MCRFITDANFPCVSPSLIHKVGPATQASGFTCITVVLSLSNRSLSLFLARCLCLSSLSRKMSISSRGSRCVRGRTLSPCTSPVRIPTVQFSIPGGVRTLLLNKLVSTEHKASLRTGLTHLRPCRGSYEVYGPTHAVV